MRLENIEASHSSEVLSGTRFQFGKNWQAFLSTLDEERIAEAENSLVEMLDSRSLVGKTFLDIGSGSGLFSLAARRLGARVFSFDYDTQSVACTTELRTRYFPDDPQWTIEQGSILDSEYIRSLGSFDIVYSWGVLHHTGDMWKAIQNAAIPVSTDGKMFIAIYNDVGSKSERWRLIKKSYCGLPDVLKTPFAIAVTIPQEAKTLIASLLRGKPFGYLSEWKQYKAKRGMSRWHDIVDWVGGYPYEYAGPSAIFDFMSARGFSLTKMKCDNVGLGCNEMVFQRDASRPM